MSVRRRVAPHLQRFFDLPVPAEAKAWPAFRDWPNYRARYALTKEDVPDLLALMKVPRGGWDDKTWSACVRARRALAQLGAPEALPVFVDQIGAGEDAADEYGESEAALCLYGREAVTHLIERWEAGQRHLFMLDVLSYVGGADPDAREEVLDFFVERLRERQGYSGQMQAFFLHSLARLDTNVHAKLAQDVFVELRARDDVEWYAERWDDLWAYFERVEDKLAD